MSLQREIAKQKPFETAEVEAFLNLQRTASRLMVECDRLLRCKGLSGPTYNILRILRGAGEVGRLTYEIGRMLVAEVPDMTRLLDRLERLELVSRRRETDDRRQVRVFITTAGLKVLGELDQPMVELHQTQLGHLGQADLCEFNRLLEAARNRPS